MCLLCFLQELHTFERTMIEYEEAGNMKGRRGGQRQTLNKRLCPWQRFINNLFAAPSAMLMLQASCFCKMIECNHPINSAATLAPKKRKDSLACGHSVLLPLNKCFSSLYSDHEGQHDRQDKKEHSLLQDDSNHPHMDPSIL